MAAAKTKTIESWERAIGVMLNIDIDQDRSITREEFNDLMNAHGFTGVDHEQRLKFLQDNGYEPSRSNMRNHELSVRTGVDEAEQ